MHSCPCCSEITYINDNPGALCPECEDNGCVYSQDAVGDWGYFNCQRVDEYDEDDYYDVDDDSYDEYPEENWRGYDPYDIEYDRFYD